MDECRASRGNESADRLDHDVLYGNRLVKFRGYVEKLSVVFFVIWELRVIFEEVRLSLMHIVQE